MSENIYYTYAWLREDGTPYYIGKGKDGRAFDTKRQFCPPLDRVLILKRNLSEIEAFKHEVYMIAVFGRKDLGTGILRNLTDGGDGCSGLIFSEESKRRISERISGEGNPFYGKKHSDETKKKISEALTGKIGPNKGRKFSDESRKKMSEAKKGKVPHNKGKAPSEETKQKISKANAGRVHSAEARKRMSEGQKLAQARRREAKKLQK
jgi:hypothetical protein